VGPVSYCLGISRISWPRVPFSKQNVAADAALLIAALTILILIWTVLFRLSACMRYYVHATTGNTSSGSPLVPNGCSERVADCGGFALAPKDPVHPKKLFGMHFRKGAR
jgi:hypothetical protein